MSISYIDNNIKVWNANNWYCIISITNINKAGYLYSSCFLNQNNQIYIITSNYKEKLFGKTEPIKIFNLNGKFINEINNSNEQTFFIDTYYDNILSKNYIIVGNYNFSQSYDFDRKNVYQK